MKIFFDHQAFSLQNYGGISRYFCELIAGINTIGDYDAYLSLLWSNNVHLKDYNIYKSRYPLPGRHRLLQLTNQLLNVKEATFKNYDIYHATYFDDFLIPYVKSRPIVTTFYDMTYERLSSRFIELSDDKQIISQKYKIAHKSTHIIAISESTKQDIIELLDVKPEKVSVIHLGSPFVQHEIYTEESGKEKQNNKPYLLYVGNRAGYKNFLPFLKSIANLLFQYDLNLVCAGGGDFTKEEKEVIQSNMLSKFVVQIPINDSLLQRLYKEAIAFVFPSLYEGFGIPVLEAFSCNCPCIISNNSSLPEVAGDAALYINPEDSDNIVSTIESFLLSDVLREQLIIKGRERALKFSWAKTIDQTIKLYEKLI